MSDNYKHPSERDARNYFSRRSFVRTGALGLGAAAAWPLLAHSSERFLAAEAPQQSNAEITGSLLRLSNEFISAEFMIDGGGLRISQLQHKRASHTINHLSDAFWMSFEGKPNIASSQLRLVGEPRIETLTANPQASQMASRLGGRQIVAEFRDAGGTLGATWRAVLRDSSHYIRQEVVLRALKADLPIDTVCLIDVPLQNASVIGTVAGSPITQSDWFFGFEHPLSASTAGGGRARATIDRPLPLKANQEVAYSSVIGVAAPGQMRRDFLRYVERERAHPYRTFLHYNTWYDFEPFTEAQVVDAIDAFGQELHVKRGVTLDSFLLDDGWDDHKFWAFNSGFPHGFDGVAQATAKYQSKPGVWLSPWGGYAKARQERLEYAKQNNFEINADGLALSGPVYYKRFREVCLNMVRDYGVNQFKFDGTGSSSDVIPGSQFGSDFAAAIALIDDLRAAEPDLYVNLTTGTYPSPFWLRYADSTWRGGDDHSFSGVGTSRQQWITYRDADTFRNVVAKGPLYPLNSLMLHGIIFAKRAHNLDTDPGDDFSAEVRSYFGTGTQCQEMYITHSLLADKHWDVLAESAKWSRKNADVLADTHWVGGDPNLLEAYGWAAWSPRKAILTLRNPADRPQTMEIDPQIAFELPQGSPAKMRMKSPWQDTGSSESIELRPGRTTEIILGPFQVMTLETAG